jgi:Glycosyl hydrolases family 16/Chitobiase/beta-hexosaminidase C-terminal domain
VKLLLLVLFLLVGSAFGQNYDNIYCPASNIPTWGSVDGPATLPTACYNTAIANTPATGSVVNVSTAAQLTTALAAAACGQKITLAAGASFLGHFTVPALVCPSSNYLWIQSSGVASLPAEGARYSTTYNSNTVYAPTFGPCYAGVTSLPGRPTLSCPGTPGTYTAQIITPNSVPALTFTAGTSGVRLIGLEITRTPGTGYTSVLVAMGQVGNLDHIIFDRVWMHGDENQDETETGFNASAASYVASVDSYYNNFYCITGIGACIDSHPIISGLNGVNSTQESVLKVVNNYLEGAGENYLSGGGKSNTVPLNQEFRLNLFFKPLTWNPSDPSYNGGISGHQLIIKNLFELKNTTLALMEGNQFFNNWSGAQNGEAWKISAINQNLGTVNQCPVCATVNFTARYNAVNTANVFTSILMQGNGNGAAGNPAAMNSISVHDNVADNLGNLGSAGLSSVIIVGSLTINTIAQAMFGISVNHNTIVQANGAPSLAGAKALGNPLISSGFAMHDITVTNNAWLTQTNGTQNFLTGANDCAATGSGGTAMINNCWATYTVGGNDFITNGAISWPGTNVTSIANQAAAYVNWNNGNAGDYTIAAGAAKGAATDGTDPGANLPRLALVLGGGTAVAPTFSPVAGTYTGAQAVSLSTTSPYSIICYNMTGSPATNGTGGCAAGSTLYTGFLTVPITEIVYAVAGGFYYIDSSVASAAYVISNTAVTPTFLPPGGTYASTQLVTISSASSVPTYQTTFSNLTDWTATNAAGPVEGGGSFSSAFASTSSGMLQLKLTQDGTTAGSVGSEVSYTGPLSFGVGAYEWSMRASSTSATPTGAGAAASGSVSAGFTFFNNSQTEIDTIEIEGQTPNLLEFTNWNTLSHSDASTATATFTPDAGFHLYRSVWTSTEVDYYVDGILQAQHTASAAIPTHAAPPFVNHWGTNSATFGGISTPGTRYLYANSFKYWTSTAQAIICYTTNGTTPATNGTTGCTTGTKYTTAVSVATSETLKAVAGGTGFADSPVGSAVYVIVPASSYTFTITGTGTLSGTGVIQ